MIKNKKIDDEINEFLNEWGAEYQISFLRDILPLFELYDVEDESDWVKEAVGEENESNVRMIRTVYLMSRIAESYAGKLSTIRVRYKDLWKRMQKYGLENG